MTRYALLLAALLAVLGLLACPTPRGGGGSGGDDDDNEDDDDASDDDDNQDDDDVSDDDDDVQPDDDDAGGCGADEVEDCNDNCGPLEWVGDGYCDDETYEYEGNMIDFNCSEFSYDGGDCAGGDDDDAGGCSDHPECDGDEFCYGGECELIFGRSFHVTVWEATADQFDENGNNWDLTDAPDPYAVVQLDSNTMLTTTTVEDSLTVTWTDSVDLTLTNTSLCVAVYDEDVGSDDLMDGSCWNGQSPIVSLVRNYGFQGDLYSGLVEVYFEILPNF